MTEALDVATHCVLAYTERGRPQLLPMAFWYDGTHLWLSVQSDSREVAALRRDGRCAVYVPPVEGGAYGAVVRGDARVFGLHDPLGLALHGATISAAMAALAARNAFAIAGYVQDASRVPARLLPRNRVAVRVDAVRCEQVPPVAPGPGIAPGLPTIIPANVRRAVAGRRDVVVATVGENGPEAGPAVWGAGFRLTLPPERELSIGAPVAVLVQTDPHTRPSATAGVVLAGTVGPGDVLRAGRATTWSGFEQRTVDVPASRPGVVLPD